MCRLFLLVNVFIYIFNADIYFSLELFSVFLIRPIFFFLGGGGGAKTWKFCGVCESTCRKQSPREGMQLVIFTLNITKIFMCFLFVCF